jgi:hypothetical protein
MLLAAGEPGESHDKWPGEDPETGDELAGQRKQRPVKSPQ